ncbi:hypothetical protein [Bradyrhizobium liaoningense]|uniref:hypothetical protein n=1 Tax=Bradyrhizobium liaoningense TaxID=43992 RepID=UPI001BA48208|nr:hypothetical protein [Bradyrhizobium liaoningense]MBR0712931.1 hypothetical protein [Bradyrhizobium liaoningense]
MNDDVDYDLTSDQWEALKALRHHALRDRRVKAYLIEDLAKLGLVAVSDGLPLLTPTGRKVLVRGSCRLLDLAA